MWMLGFMVGYVITFHTVSTSRLEELRAKRQKAANELFWKALAEVSAYRRTIKPKESPADFLKRLEDGC